MKRHLKALPLLLLFSVGAIAQDENAAVAVSLASVAVRARVPPPGDTLTVALSPRVSLPALSQDEIARHKDRYKTSVGQDRDLPAGSFHGQWIANAQGQWIWSMSLHAASAGGLRLHFTNFDVGKGQAWIHDGTSGSGQVYGPYTGRGPFEDGEFWTELISGDSVWLEYLSADGQLTGPPPFTVTQAFELWAQAAPVNLGCFLDERCYENNANVAQFSNGVAFLLFSDHSCSGTLVNDRNSTSTPYLLTAGHCILNDSDARSMLAVFGFKTSGCNGPASNFGAYPQVSGSALLARNLHSPDGSGIIPDQPDFAFVRLAQLPASSTFLMGWTFNPSGSERMTSVSHPRGLPQRLAAGNIISSSDPNFFTVNMTFGAVDHGSSGSGLANDGNQLVGLDSYGPTTPDVSACDVSDRRNGYTKFAAIYPAISQWLEAAAQAVASVSPVALNFGTQQSGTTSGVQSVTVSNVGKGTMTVSSISIQGAASGEFGQTNTCSTSLTAGASCAIRIFFRPGSAGSKTATIQIADNSAGSPQIVALSGTGSSSQAPPTVLNQVTSVFNAFDSGTCRAPASASSFSTTTAAVWLYFDVTGVRASDVFHLTYYRPDGSLYTTLNAPSNYDGYVCFSYYLSVAGYPPASLPGQWTIRTFWNQSTTPLFTMNFTLTPPTALPIIGTGGVVNGASLVDGIASGGFLTVFGSNLSTNGTQGWSIPGNKLPTSTAGSQVLVNGKPAYVSYASPTQINAIVPADSFVGPVSVQVITANGASTPATVTKRAVAPALFMLDQGGRRYAVATLPDSAIAAPAGLIPPGVLSRPAKSGDVVSLWANGLGPTNPMYPDGQLITVQNRGVLTLPYSVVVGGKTAQVDWAGIVGAGLYQVNFHVPQLPQGDASLQIVVNGVASPTGVNIYIGP